MKRLSDTSLQGKCSQVLERASTTGVTMMGALADIKADTGEILAILRDEEEGDEEEEVDA
jgi:hypothetical protein